MSSLEWVLMISQDLHYELTGFCRYGAICSASFDHEFLRLNFPNFLQLFEKNNNDKSNKRFL